MLLILAVLASAACGSDDDTPTVATTASTTATTAAVSTTSEPVITTAAPKPGIVIDEQGICKLRLGMTVAQASATGQIGPTEPGCEPAGELSAELQFGGVTGSVTFRDGVIQRYAVRSGAKTATGVGPGSTVAQIQQAYANGYEVEVDHGTEEQFGITLVRVRRAGAARFGFDVPTDTGKAKTVSVPEVGFCE